MQKLILTLIPSLIAIVLFVVISSYEGLSSLLENDQNLPIANLDFETYSEGINTILYDNDGYVDYTLHAKTQIQFDDDLIEIEEPFIKLYKNGESYWNIVANSGRILPNNKYTERILELSGDVEIFGIDDYGNRTKISTEYLKVDPNNEILETDRQVQFIAPTLQQSSLGMFANLKTDEIIFHHKIRGSYEKIPN
ncbi:MAG: LPS export ABC transporter periplasmic protein LptC [Gammaproteobacteria bacterium]|nr:LPS export ABC transporter periplasmic protein LptC [Gammaproteobacteria bacterium]